MVTTPLNLEQSIARYLADKFKLAGYSIYWFDTKQTEGSGVRVSILRKFPPQSSQFVRQASTLTTPGIIKVPAFSVFVNGIRATDSDRTGIGDGSFIWSADMRIDGFADSELEWYKIRGWFREWFGIDNRTSIYDYQSDINIATPPELNYQLQYKNTSILGEELDETPAVRYYINCLSTLEFVE